MNVLAFRLGSGNRQLESDPLFYFESVFAELDY
jgi:hypothetical protein